MRILLSSPRNYTQVGFILDSNEGFDYRYPLSNLSYIEGSFSYNSSTPCNKQEGSYDSRCTGGYTLLKSKKHQVLVYNEDNQTKVFLSASEGAFVYYLPLTYFDSLFDFASDYTFFLTDFSGERVIHMSSSAPLNGTVWEVLYPGDPLLESSAQTNMGLAYLNLTKSPLNNTMNFSVIGYNSEFMGVLTELDLNVDTAYGSGISEKASMAVGVTIDKGLVFSNWNNVLDGVITIIIIQMVIFLTLLCITIAVVWFLSLSITNRITYPIYLFEEYLRGRISLQSMDKNYNREVNQILMYLRMIETLEKIIDPCFLKNPKAAIREQNLKEALKLFEDIKSRRGKSIIFNLLGNIRYQYSDYTKAVSYYRNALSEAEDLSKEVQQQENDEKALTSAERTILLKKLGKTDDPLNWESEKVFLSEMIIERKQQLCMGLLAEMHESALDLSEIRRKLKEIYGLQHEGLQYYAATRTHYLRLLKVMVDIAGAFQELKYYHSSLELLDIVQDELCKIDVEAGPEIDIDITRLGKIGVNIKVDDENNHKKLHFIVQNITFERDVLMQAMHYRRGLLLLEDDKHYDAAMAFTLAIVRDI